MNEKKKPSKPKKKNYEVHGAPLRELIDKETELKLFKMTVEKR